MKLQVDYEVRSPTGALLFTSDDPALAVRWARNHCALRYPLTVERVEHRRSHYHTANHLQNAFAS